MRLIKASATSAGSVATLGTRMTCSNVDRLYQNNTVVVLSVHMMWSLYHAQQLMGSEQEPA